MLLTLLEGTVTAKKARSTRIGEWTLAADRSNANPVGTAPLPGDVYNPELVNVSLRHHVTPTIAGAAKYKRAPIAEAVCEFVFTAVEDWDPTVAGRLYEQIKGSYPSRPRPQQTVAAHIMGREGLRVQMNQGLGKVQLADLNRKNTLSIGPNGISIHTTGEPYLGWEEAFFPRISEAMLALKDVDSDLRIRRVGVRYVNRITGVLGIAEARELVRTLPASIKGLPEKDAIFFARMEFVHEDATKLLVTTGKADSPEPALIVDIDAIREPIEPPKDPLEALALVHSLKRHVNEAFELVITDTARRRFDDE
ncbi:MAG: TIGR04255 family protein [Dehalococcoidia bacterium]